MRRMNDMTNAKLIKSVTVIAENLFDKQMLDVLEVVKKVKKLHSQHKFMLLEYYEANKKREGAI